MDRHDIVFTGLIVGGTAPILLKVLTATLVSIKSSVKDSSSLENSWAIDYSASVSKFISSLAGSLIIVLGT